jgi:hypothetical protein
MCVNSVSMDRFARKVTADGVTFPCIFIIRNFVDTVADLTSFIQLVTGRIPHTEFNCQVDDGEGYFSFVKINDNAWGASILASCYYKGKLLEIDVYHTVRICKDTACYMLSMMDASKRRKENVDLQTLEGPGSVSFESEEDDKDDKDDRVSEITSATK